MKKKRNDSFNFMIEFEQIELNLTVLPFFFIYELNSIDIHSIRGQQITRLSISINK